MKQTKNIFLIVCIMSFSILAKKDKFFIYCPVRNVTDIPADLIKRVRNAGYTHFIYPLDKTASAKDYEGMFSTFDIATDGELKYVPLVNLASKWAGRYGLKNSSLNIQKYRRGDGTTGTRYCPSFASDSSLTVAIKKILESIRDGYKASGASKNGNLKYFFWGHDEPVENGELLCANGSESQSTADLHFIDSCLKAPSNNTPNIAFRKLFINEVEQRLDDLERYPLFSDTKAIIFADMWDPETNGAIPFKVSSLVKAGVVPLWTRITLAPNNPNDTMEIVNLPGCSDIKRFREKVILATWCYEEKWSKNNPHPPVIPEKTFKYFAENNLKFMFTSSSNYFADDPILPRHVTMIHKYVDATKKYRDGLLQGYIGAAWTNHAAKPTGEWDKTKPINKQTGNFEIIEMLRDIFNEKK